MTSTQEEVILTRDVIATLIPHGEEFTLGSGEKVTITHRLGGNFTVMTLQGMYRIAARDADALGEANKLSDEKNVPKGGKPAENMNIALVQHIWTTKEIPEELSRALICLIPKKGGDRSP